MILGFAPFLLFASFSCVPVENSARAPKDYDNSSFQNNQGYVPPTYQQPYYAPQQQPYYQQPQRSLYQQRAPASRFYSNPYAIPPTNQYPYYDADQYYVPPTYYNNSDDNAFPSR